MCTYIVHSAPVTGAGKGAEGWFQLEKAVVGFDHPFKAELDHALLIDFTGAGGRVGVEMNIASGKALVAKLQAAIEEAERSGVAE